METGKHIYLSGLCMGWLKIQKIKESKVIWLWRQVWQNLSSGQGGLSWDIGPGILFRVHALVTKLM